MKPSIFFVGDAYRGADILASHAVGIASYWEGKPLGWYRLDSLQRGFTGPFHTKEEAEANVPQEDVS